MKQAASVPLDKGSAFDAGKYPNASATHRPPPAIDASATAAATTLMEPESAAAAGIVVSQIMAADDGPPVADAMVTTSAALSTAARRTACVSRPVAETYQASAAGSTSQSNAKAATVPVHHARPERSAPPHQR